MSVCMFLCWPVQKALLLYFTVCVLLRVIEGLPHVCCAPQAVSRHTCQEQCLLRLAYLMINSVSVLALPVVMYAGNMGSRAAGIGLCLLAGLCGPLASFALLLQEPGAAE